MKRNDNKNQSNNSNSNIIKYFKEFNDKLMFIKVN